MIHPYQFRDKNLRKRKKLYISKLIKTYNFLEEDDNFLNFNNKSKTSFELYYSPNP